MRIVYSSYKRNGSYFYKEMSMKIHTNVMMLILIPFLLIGCSGKCVADGVEKPAEAKLQEQTMTDEQQIIAEFEKFQQAMIDKDTVYLRTCLGKKVRHMSGKVESSDDWLAEVESGVMNYYSYKIKNARVSISGDTATLDCDTELNAKVYGVKGVWTLPSHSTYKKNRWLEDDIG
jgi:hypothetical protein